MTTTGSSPTTQALWPGGIAATSPGTLAFPDETRTTNNRIQFLTCELALTRGKHTTTQVLNYRCNRHPNLAGARCAPDVTRMRAVREDRLDRLHNSLSSILMA